MVAQSPCRTGDGEVIQAVEIVQLPFQNEVNDQSVETVTREAEEGVLMLGC